ncbi:hypothetical protein FUAX_19420 [Fulvitalea axinellae]|uniref:DUF2971 domain-containing protein n=1 Tax=Fulvitalea axinellae TaxID=1182444 RepID=A0AAU9DAX4_9BACT|nr:hypothetical protein FUAX_19420 [Fulvitalea axinellae]
MQVFKYRGGDREIFERDLSAIEKNFFWGSNFKQLNDPCETLISSDRFKSETKTFFNLTNKNSEKVLEKVHDALDTFINRGKEIGIYSLSATYNDELLWAHYANSHQGFCIEYDLDLLLESYPSDKIYSFPIKYSKNPPEIDISDISGKDGISLVRKLAGNKSKKWDYENEYRIITDKSGEHTYNFKAIQAIYFGLRMPEPWKKEMMTILHGRGIKYYQIFQVEGKYEFDRQEVPDISGSEVTYLRQIPSLNGKKSSINFEIIEKDFNKFNEKATILIELDSKADREQLIWIANKIKEDLFRSARRIFISFRIHGVIAGNGYWATANFDGKELQVSINGLSLEQEKELIEGFENETRETIGMWIDETPFICSSLTLLFNDGATILETKYSDGSKSLEQLKTTQLGSGIRYDNLQGNYHGEYFIVENNGTLKYYSENGLFKELTPFHLEKKLNKDSYNL